MHYSFFTDLLNRLKDKFHTVLLIHGKALQNPFKQQHLLKTEPLGAEHPPCLVQNSCFLSRVRTR